MSKAVYVELLANADQTSQPIDYFLEAMQTSIAISHPFFRPDNPRTPLNGMAEEVEELREAHAANDRKEMRNEAGDVLFFLLKYCVENNLSFNEVARVSLRRWLRRQAELERRLAAEGKTLADVDEPTAAAHWRELKKVLKPLEHTE